MEKDESAERSRQRVILVIMSINLTLTFAMCALFAIAAFAPNSPSSKSVDAVTLPTDLATQESRATMFEEFRQKYNSGDNNLLLSMFGEAYRMGLQESDFAKRIAPVREMASTINGGAYTHFEYETLATGVTNFDLCYNVDTPVGIRKLRLTFAQQGKDPSCLTGVSMTNSN